MSVQLLSDASQDGGTVVHAIYQLIAPRGAFFPQDDTGYHVALTPSGPGTVLDSSGTAFPSGILALYEVEINPFSATFSFADSTGASFVDVAMMAPVPPLGMRVGMFMAGSGAEELAAFYRPFGTPVGFVDQRGDVQKGFSNHLIE